MKPIFTTAEKKVIFFDLSDTLIDRQQTFNISFLKALDEFTGRWDKESTDWNPKNILSEYEKSWRKIKHGNKKKKSLTGDATLLTCIKESFQSTPFPTTDTFLQTFLKRLKEIQKEEAVPFPDAKDTLATLAKSYKLGVISNSSERRQKMYLHKLGLESLITPQPLTSLDSRKYKKPDPAIYQLALQKMGVRAPQAVMAGNSWRNDIFGATRSGMDAVWIRSAHKKVTIKKVGKEKIVMIGRCRQLLSIFQS